MEKEQVAAEVNTLMVQTLGLNASDVRPEAFIARDLGVDSLDFCGLIAEAEKKFLIIIPDEDVDRIFTVGDLTKYILTHAGETSPGFICQ